MISTKGPGRGWFGTLAALILIASGCQYRWGGVAHPQIRSLAVGTFANETREGSAVATLRGRLTEAVSSDPGLTLAQPDVADAIIEGRILRVGQRHMARAKVRDEADTEHDADAYQAVLYRLTVTVEYQVRIPGHEKPIMARREALGEADLGPWPDPQMGRSQALELALAEAAKRMVAEVTEAW